MRDVVLAGELGRRYGRRHRFAVRSPGEALRALCANYPTLRRDLIQMDRAGNGYLVFNGRDNIGADRLELGGDGKIVIAPAISGAKRNGVLQVIAGVVLVVAGVLVTGLSYGWAAPVGEGMIAAGIGLIVGGVIQLLTPLPKTEGPNDDNSPNNVFDGPVNTTAQGFPVPIGYGEAIVGSAVISAGIDVAIPNEITRNDPPANGGLIP